jgi:hypothetical protein
MFQAMMEKTSAETAMTTVTTLGGVLVVFVALYMVVAAIRLV